MLSRNERKFLNSQRRKASLEGKGRYLYQNITNGDLMLPRPLKGTNQTFIPYRGKFESDDYYMFMVNETHQLRKLADLEEEKMQIEEKLITEQPPVVTTDGTVEYVVEKPHVEKPKGKKLREHSPSVEQVEILLNENPLDGVELI